MMNSHLELLILVLSTIFKVSYSENQFFRVRPKDQESKEGDEVEFKCHIGNRAGSVQWSKDGFLLGFDPKIPGFPRYFMEVKEKEGIYNLHIKEVKFQDEGEFQCQVGPALNNTPIRSVAKLRILIPPDYITVNGLGQASTMEVKQNTTVQLTCQAVGSKPAAQLVWYRDNIEVPKESVHYEERKGKKRYTATSYLTIRPLIQDNGVKFACEAVHKALDQKMRTEVTLSVLHPPGVPRIEGYEEGTIVRAGEALTLVCISEGGNPPPQLIWYRSNAQIDATYYPIMGESATANNLTFTVSATDNTGSYYCQASNAATKEPLTASIKLNVYYLSNKLSIKGPNEVPRGGTVTLSCITDISNPKSEISWTVDGKRLKATKEVIEAKEEGWITTSNVTITLSRQEPDVKEFSCYAKNNQVSGTASVVHKLRIVYPPRPPTILGYDLKTSLRVGDMQKFNCVSVGGNPPAILRWFKGDREISAPVISIGSGVASELIIRVQLSDNGAYYRCESFNSALKKPLSAFVRVSVFFPPMNVTIAVHPVEPRAGDNVTISCISASSNPVSRITWMRDETTLKNIREETVGSVYGGYTTRSRIFIIVSPSDDETQFTCSAKCDEFKTIVKDYFTLRVRHVPVFLKTTHNLDMLEQSSVIINMTAKAYPEHITYVWSKKEIPVESGKMSQRISSSGPILDVRNATRKDSGTYVCTAENEEGQTRISITLNVLYGASIESLKIISPSGAVFEGGEVTIECRTTANPTKSDMIKWRNKGIIQNGRQNQDNSISVLHISNISREYRGLVECWADNGVGSPAFQSIMLNILYKPLVLQSGGELNDGVGDIKCIFDATPNVTVTWALNNTVLKEDALKYSMSLTNTADVHWLSVLTIRNINYDDYGIYSCIARNNLGFDSADIILNERGVIPDVTTPALVPKDAPSRFQTIKSWWITATAGALVIVLPCFIFFICSLRKRSNRTTPQRSRETRHLDINNLTSEEVCNKLMLSGDVKSILLCTSEKHLPLHDYKGQSVFTIEDPYSLDKVHTRHDHDSKSLGNPVRDTLVEDIPPSSVTSQRDCPDILKNEKCLCLVSMKENGEDCMSPQSDSPESPRFNSTPSGSTGSCLSVYHEKTSIRSLAGDVDSAALAKLHPIMVIRIEEDLHKLSET
ncbi:synaptogenesis protein syg-2 [Parasteatoda tepidariorum]|uniref:synaptogenesis protein syg-2 n=1 Tax=Parasteatoda tepidariorum TaxID=114398 RepID=UPI0039BCE34F